MRTPPYEYERSVKAWCKRQMKRRRGAIIKGKLRGTERDHEIREEHLVRGGQRTCERRMREIRKRAMLERTA